MAAPIQVALVGVEVSAATAKEYVIIRNITRGAKLTGALGTNKQIVFNKAPTSEWQNGDLIQAEIRGRVQGVKQETIRHGGATIKISAEADTTTPGVSL